MAKDRASQVHPTITVSDDRMEAVLFVPAGDGLDLAQIKELVTLNALCVGIDGEVIKQAHEACEHDRKLTIARGRPPRHGSDGEVIMHLDSAAAFARREDGSIDFWEAARIKDVTKGQVLAEYQPATLGKHGLDVYGEPAEATPGRDLDFDALSGSGTALPSGKPRRLIATRNGVFHREGDGAISVVEQVTVEGNVNLHVGNIDTDHAVLIKGDVNAGFAIKSSGDVRIDGVVENARVSAAGDVIVAGGILAGDERIKAHGDVHAMFIHERTVKASNVLVGKSIRHANILATGDVAALDVLGGNITCGGSVEVVDVGSPRGDRTRIQVGFDPYQRALQLQEAQAAAAAEAEARGVSVDKVEVEIPDPPPPPNGVTVTITGTLNPPFEVWFGSEMHWKVNSPTSNVVLRVSNGKIVAVPGVIGSGAGSAEHPEGASSDEHPTRESEQEQPARESSQEHPARTSSSEHQARRGSSDEHRATG